MSQCAGNDEEYHDDGQNEPEKHRSAVVRVIGDAIEPASVSLIFNNEILEDERLGERDHRTVDAIDVAFERDDAKQKGEQRRKQQCADYSDGRADQRRHEPRKFGQAVPFHKIGEFAPIARRMSERVIDLERQRDEVRSNAEIDRLAETENTSKPPDQVDAKCKNCKAETAHRRLTRSRDKYRSE